MDTKLTLEHLESYPKDEDKGLLVQTCTRFCSEEGKPLCYKIGRLVGISAMTGVIVSFNDEYYPEDYDLNQVKPILRPLSDLTKEIEFDGKRFVPYDLLKTVVSENQWDRICDSIDVNGGEYSRICDMPYWYVDLILKWHFDIYGLIEKGLAIDVNTNEAALELLAINRK